MSTSLFLPMSMDGKARTIILQEDDAGHRGDRYTMLHKQTIAGSASTAYIEITTNSEKSIHLAVTLESDGAGIWRMSEGAVTSGGMVLQAFNNNRSSLNTPDAVMKADVSVATVGTVIGYHIIGSSTGGASKSGGSLASRNEWILAPNTTYLFSFTSVTAGTQIVEGMYFYEG